MPRLGGIVGINFLIFHEQTLWHSMNRSSGLLWKDLAIFEDHIFWFSIRSPAIGRPSGILWVNLLSYYEQNFWTAFWPFVRRPFGILSEDLQVFYEDLLSFYAEALCYSGNIHYIISSSLTDLLWTELVTFYEQIFWSSIERSCENHIFWYSIKAPLWENLLAFYE